ncbi:MAG: nucleotide kinase domain-containing protein [Cyanobacteria bacterium P01_H01_bin.35]
MKNKRPKQGKLIVFEGPDGVGKTTLSKEIAKYLEESGNDCELLSFPGRKPGTVGKLIYDLHHEPSKFGVESLTTASQQMLHIAAHLDAIESHIVPAIKAGKYVILDRYWWSTWVYGVVSGINRRLLQSMIEPERLQWENIKPSPILFIRRDTPIDRNVNLEHWQKLSQEYNLLAAEEQKNYPVVTIDNTNSLEITIEKIQEVLEQKLTVSRSKSSSKRIKQGLQLSLQLSLDWEKPSAPRPEIISHITPAKPTIVFDTYWRFAAERQKIFFKKLENRLVPWTDDPILSTYKFTNAYRASDRTSQYLINHVIYRNDLPNSIDEVFFRIILFKIFNKIETWNLLEKKLGPIVYSDYSFDRYNKVLVEAMASSQAIYSAAYIMPSGGKQLGGYTAKHQNHLKLIENMMLDELPKELADAKNMHRGFDLFRKYPTIGDFLAYQFITDVNYSQITNFSEMDFVIPGPGALDGIRKCFLDLGGLNEPEIIKLMVDRQESEFERLGLEFQSLWGRKLQLIDCQNLFCEVDKYSRIRHPDISGISGRTRIKQKYFPNMESIDYCYPPKWGINQAVEKYKKNLNPTQPK